MTTTWTPASPGPGSAPGAGPGRPRFGLGLFGPRRGRHELAPEEYEALALPVGDDGVVIGTDPHGAPAVLGVARPTPFDAVLIGGAWTAQVIALRTVGTGARVAVETGRRGLWTPLAQAANGGQQCVTLHDVGRVPPQGPSVHAPVLVMRDCGARPPRGRAVTAPWQSVLTLLPYLGPDAPRLLGGADLVGVQRVSPEEAQQLGSLLGLPQTDVEALPALPETVTLWCARRSWTYVDVRATDTETQLLGAPRRMD
ncbi:hypothetical protein [Streptomyces telluris]|uniref:Uncharacterized protein n=1 Tax=Streptomyces telluris TaxID=2720021 RepID=A0A9X2LC89_9ACTN|nr:hypothetical protein [Streptomyces telluris]MCQ8768589.1 hypothetical protein [Streptomyces telluris]NJP78816.1 hypothetical protein [Streptomyces telluris]